MEDASKGSGLSCRADGAALPGGGKPAGPAGLGGRSDARLPTQVACESLRQPGADAGQMSLEFGVEFALETEVWDEQPTRQRLLRAATAGAFV